MKAFLRGTLRGTFVLGILALFAASSASPCSRAYSGTFGPVWTGESWAYFGQAPPELRVPGVSLSALGSVVLFDSSGLVISAESVRAPKLADGSFFPRTVAADGSLWGTVSCSDRAEPLEPLCDRAVRVDAQGEVLEVGEKGVWEPWRIEPDLEVQMVGGPGTDRPTPYRLHVQRKGDEPQLLKSPLAESERLLGRAQWVANEQGSIAVLWLGDTQVHLLRYDPQGEEQAHRFYARSHRAGLRDGPDARIKLAGGQMLLASDGSLVLGGWSINPDCTPRHASSFIVLDPEGELRAWVAGDEVLGMALSSDDVLAVARGGSRDLELFDLDGQVVGTLGPPQPWREERELLTAVGAEIGPESDPADWIRYYNFIDVGPGSDGPATDDWIVGAWPANAGQLPGFLARQLGPRLCDKERDLAPQNVLKAFREEGNYSQRLEYFPALVACFDEPPEDAVALARLAESRKDPYQAKPAQEALAAWGLKPLAEARSPDRQRRGARTAPTADEAWQALLAGDLSGRSRVAAGNRTLLVSSLPQIEQRVLDAVAAGGTDAEKVLDLLYDVVLHAPMGNRDAASHEVLARWVAAWADVATTEVTVLRDLLAVTLDADPAASVRLFDAASENGETGFWLGLALAGALKAQHPVAPDGAPDPALPAMARRYLAEVHTRLPEGCRVAGNTVDCRGAGSIDPLFVLASSAGDAAVDAVWSRAESEDPLDRQMVLRVAGVRSELLSDEQWRWLLGLSRLEERESLRQTLQLLGGHPGASNATWSLAEQLFDRLVALHGIDTVLRVGNLMQPNRGPIGGRNPLVDLIEPSDLAWLAESDRDLGRWLPLIAEVGAFPQIAGRLEAMLNGHAGVQAAAALAALGDRRALEVLLDRGLTEWIDPVPGLRHFGAEAVDRLVPLAHHENETARSNARRALRQLGMPRTLAGELAEEAQARLAAGEIPELESWLVAARDNRKLAQDFVRQLAEGAGSLHWRGSQRPEWNSGVIDLVAQMAAAGSQVRSVALELLESWSTRSPGARSALAGVR